MFCCVLLWEEKPCSCVLRMDLRVFLLAALLSGSSGVSLVHGPPETVLALAGGDVTLPCSFSTPAREDFPTVEWSKEGLKPNVVFLYRDGCETAEMKNPAFRYRTSLITKELKNGNISLRISNVQLTDAGRYRCMRLWRMAPWDITTVELVVGAVSEPKLSITSAEGGGVTLQCVAGCWLPEPEIQFLDGQGNEIPADEPKRDRDARGCFSLTRRAALQDATKRITCRVHQPEINQTRAVEILLPGVGSWSCFLPVVIAAVTVLLLCGALCTLAVLLWKRCRRPAEEPNSPTSSYQSTRSGSCEDKSLLPRVQIENTINTTIEMLTMKVEDLEVKLKDKERTILQLRSNNGAQLIAVVCQDDQPVFLDSPAASTNSGPPASGHLPQNRRNKPGFLRQISHPAPGRSIAKCHRRHSSPARLSLFSGSAGPSDKRPGRISDPRAFGLGPNVKLQRRHSLAFPSPAPSNGPFTRLANVTEESEMLIA